MSQVGVLAFNKSTIWTHDGANAKCVTNWDETDYSVPFPLFVVDDGF